MDVCYHRTDSLTTPYLKFFTEKCVEMRFIMKKCRKPRDAPVFAGGVRRHFAFAMGRSSCIMKKMRSSRRGQGGGGAGKDPRERNVGAAGKQGEGGMPVRRKSKPQAECRSGGKARRGRNVGTAGKQGEGGMSVRRKSKPQAECRSGGKARGERNVGAAGKQGEGGMRRRGKARRGRNVGAAGKQGEGGMSVRQESKARAERRGSGKARRRRDAETREREPGNTVK